MLQIDIRFSKIALENPLLRKLLISVSASVGTSLVEMGENTGFDVLRKVFYDHVYAGEKKVEWFGGEMGYAFYKFCETPYENAWLGYLITQNGYPIQFDKQSHEKNKFPLNVHYKFKLSNYHILTPHQTHKTGSQIRHSVHLSIKEDTADIILFRRVDSKKESSF